MRLWKVFTYELKRNLRRKGYLFATFGIPVLVFVLGSILPLLFGGGTGGGGTVLDRRRRLRH